jgi:hypothetical protein
MRLDVRRVDHLGGGRSTAPGKFTEQVLPDASLSPASEAIVDRRVRAVLRRTILERQPLRSPCRMPLMTGRSPPSPCPGRRSASAVRSAAIDYCLTRIGWPASAAPFDSRDSTSDSNPNQFIGFQPWSASNL